MNSQHVMGATRQGHEGAIMLKRFARARIVGASRLACAALAVATLAACGGGGGGTTPVVTVQCPNGTTDVAANCARVNVVKTDPAAGSYVTAAFGGPIFTFDGLVSSGGCTCRFVDGAGASPPCTVSGTGTKALLVAPTAPLPTGDYTVTLSGLDSVGNPISASSSFHLCAALNAAGTACAERVPPIATSPSPGCSVSPVS